MVNVEMHSTLYAFLQTQTSKVGWKRKNSKLKIVQQNYINYKIFVLEHRNRIGGIVCNDLVEINSKFVTSMICSIYFSKLSIRQNIKK